ncbi:PREDICTED: aminopeptidase N-like isoform X2 [Priapulus caudatus]|uniref:Aminopeptidase n=1 Tax=Priapulus caudatus TaxID=37621 RepID=A0ABM1DT15_PRICU|nr:PREDICTED: aminopeptidase N-like isoform X2 [Priapulus caudatus]
MVDAEVDDISFLSASGESMKHGGNYEQMGISHTRQLVCSQRKATCVALAAAAVILAVAMISAFSRPTIEHCHIGNNSLHDATQAKPIVGLADGTSEPFPWRSTRLPRTIRPSQYDIHLQINLTEFHVNASVSIVMQVSEPTEYIILHSNNLTITSYYLKSHKTLRKIAITKLLFYKRWNLVAFRLQRALYANEELDLTIEYNMPLRDKLTGLYRSSYVDDDGKKRYIATTQFEPNSAREAFPCFDEPAFKAVFAIQIIRDKGLVSLSNKPAEPPHQFLKDEGFDWEVDVFRQTPKMSTYLVAIIVCDFKSKSDITGNNVQVAVYAPKAKIDQVDFALNITIKILDFYEDFFQIRYQLQKLDLIAIPDFKAGAMENWGMVTYRETAILYNENESSSAAQERVAIVVAHELAHQWFGNLVTMDWWSDLWLNEGFASFVEFLGTDHVKPEWNMMDQFVLTETQVAMVTDALASSRPLTVEVNDADEIDLLFDSISYQKGAAILNMLQGFLTLPILKKGLTRYLTLHEFGNAKTSDLWDALTQVSREQQQNLDVVTIMNSWTQQMGYPVVTISRQGNVLKARQQRFLLNQDTVTNFTRPQDESSYGYVWNIPITYYTESHPSDVQLIWMNRNTDNFNLDGNPEWIKANVNQTGFYRVKYDQKNWDALIRLLKSNHHVLSPADRSGLLDDAFSLSFGFYVAPKVALDMSEYLSEERDYVPWQTALQHYYKLLVLCEEKPIYRPLKKYVLELLSPVVTYIGWQDTGSHLDKYLRSTVMRHACWLDHPDCKVKVLSMFRAWMVNGTKIAPNLRSVVYGNAIKYGGDEEWEFAYKQYQDTRTPSEKKELLQALTTTTDMWHITQILDYSLQPEKIRKQDMFFVLIGVANNRLARWHVWRFVQSSWDTIIDIYGASSYNTLLKITTQHFTTEFDYNELNRFLMSRNCTLRAARQALELVRHSVEWVDRNEELIEKWLRDKSRM